MNHKCRLCIIPKCCHDPKGKVITNRTTKCTKSECRIVMQTNKPKPESFILACGEDKQ